MQLLFITVALIRIYQAATEAPEITSKKKASNSSIPATIEPATIFEEKSTRKICVYSTAQAISKLNYKLTGPHFLSSVILQLENVELPSCC